MEYESYQSDTEVREELSTGTEGDEHEEKEDSGHVEEEAEKEKEPCEFTS
jgi:hypothetical protein